MSNSNPSTATGIDNSTHTAPATATIFDYITQHAVQPLRDNKDRFIMDLIAGGTAGAVSRSAVAPLERLKIMYMCGGTMVRNVGIVQSLQNIFRDEGLRGFFRGNGANVIRIVPFTATQFASYHLFRSIVTDGNVQSISPVNKFWCGVVSGILATCLTYPLDFIRCRLSMQTNNHRVYKGMWDGLTTVARTEGFLRLYNGLLPTLVGIIPYSGIQLSMYDIVRTAICGEDEKPTAMQSFLMGSLAGVVAQTVSFPIELIRRRMQVRGFELDGVVDPNAAKPKGGAGILQEIKGVYRNDGFRGFYRGLLPNYLKIIPAAGVSFLTYEKMKELIITYREQ